MNINRASLVKTIIFALAVYFNVRYLLFLLNPAHIGNPWMFVLGATADILTIVILTPNWFTALYFELQKKSYYAETAYLRDKGSKFVNETVAFLIPTVNEDLAILQETIEHALRVKGHKEVYVLDDGHRSEVRLFTEKLKVHYLARGDRRYFKSGNLNHGLAHVSTPFVAVLDADFKVREDFLQKTLPLFCDPRIGAVQTPQVYYNQDTLFAQGSQSLQQVFYEYIQPGKSLLDSAFCVGTNVVYRCSALAEIGGIALVDHSEDVFTSLKLNEHGYKIYYLDEQLAEGLAPTDVVSFFNQQYRWAKGGLTMLIKHCTLFNRRLTFDQRLQYFSSNAFYLSGLAILLYLVNPLVAVITTQRPIADRFFSAWLWAYLPFLVCNFIFYLLLARKNRLASLALGLFCFVPFLSALINIILGVKFTWKVTNAYTVELVTRKVFPLIFYLVSVSAVAYLVLIGVLPTRLSLTPYYLFIFMNVLLLGRVLLSAYSFVLFTRNRL